MNRKLTIITFSTEIKSEHRWSTSEPFLSVFVSHSVFTFILQLLSFFPLSLLPSESMTLPPLFSWLFVSFVSWLSFHFPYFKAVSWLDSSSSSPYFLCNEGWPTLSSASQANMPSQPHSLVHVNQARWEAGLQSFSLYAGCSVFSIIKANIILTHFHFSCWASQTCLDIWGKR